MNSFLGNSLYFKLFCPLFRNRTRNGFFLSSGISWLYHNTHPLPCHTFEAPSLGCKRSMLASWWRYLLLNTLAHKAKPIPVSNARLNITTPEDQNTRKKRQGPSYLIWKIRQWIIRPQRKRSLVLYSLNPRSHSTSKEPLLSEHISEKAHTEARGPKALLYLLASRKEKMRLRIKGRGRMFLAVLWLIPRSAFIDNWWPRVRGTKGRV